MIIADGIAALPLKMNFTGSARPIYPTLLWDENNVVLVDTGTPGLLTDIQVEFDRIGVSFNRLNTVILTHRDIDHIGSMPEIAAAPAQSLSVLAHEADRPYIEGSLPYIKFNH